MTGTADRSRWAYGEAGGGEWLTVHGSALRPPVLITVVPLDPVDPGDPRIYAAVPPERGAQT